MVPTHDDFSEISTQNYKDWFIYIWLKYIFGFTQSWFSPPRKQEIFCSFIGYENTGKTTAIQNLFGKCQTEAQSPTAMLTETEAPLSTEIVLVKDRLRILEAPGLKIFSLVETNSDRLVSFISHIKKLPYIPTVLFLTASLTDSRFAGESSEFTLLLKTIFKIGKYFSDKTFSNLILLLTHSDSPGIQNTLNQRVEAYKLEFKKIFGVNPMCLLVGDMPQSSLVLHGQEQSSDFHNIFIKYMTKYSKKHSSDKSERVLKNCKVVELESIYDEELKREILQNLLEVKDNMHTENRLTSVFPSDFSSNIIVARFPQHSRTNNVHIEKLLGESGLEFDFNLVESKSKILLENEKYLQISKCALGQKVFVNTNTTGVVTKLVRLYWTIFSNANHVVRFGKIYMTTKPSNGLAKYILVKDDPNNFVFVKQAPKLRTKVTDRYYYYVEIDGGQSPFVIDGYVCLSKKETPSVSSIVSSTNYEARTIEETSDSNVNSQIICESHDAEIVRKHFE